MYKNKETKNLTFKREIFILNVRTSTYVLVSSYASMQVQVLSVPTYKPICIQPCCGFWKQMGTSFKKGSTIEWLGYSSIELGPGFRVSRP